MFKIPNKITDIVPHKLRKEARTAMKQIFITLLSVLLFSNICLAAEKTALKDETDKVNYSVGYKVGADLKRQGVELNPEALVRGVQDAVGGAEPLMTQEEMRTTLMDLQQRVREAQQKQRKEIAQKNLETGKAFLAENAKKDGVTVLPSGLQYNVITKGDGKSPKATDKVTVHYRGTLIDGSEFDSSFKRGKPATFQLNRVIKGWTEALQLMTEGSKWRLFIPADLAYGERGAGALIGPNTTLIFDVELLSVEPAK